MRVVLDTNIIVSALNFDGAEREVIELARAGRYELYLSTHILNEVSGVLLRKFEWRDEMCRRILFHLQSFATVIDPTSEVTVVRRVEADNRVLACAIDARAEYLVTGDRQDLLPLQEYSGVRIVTSRQFLSAIAYTERDDA